MLNESIAQSEAKGHIVSGIYYQALIKQEQNRISKLEKERTALINKMNKAKLSGNTEAWNEMAQKVNDVTIAIESANTAILEYNNSIRDINWQVFDLMQEKISQITKEADFLINLLSNKKLYSDNGQLTDEGWATMGLHTKNYETYMQQLKKYAEELSKIDSQLKKDSYDQTLIDRREELLELQQESISAAEDEKQAIVDMVKEGIDLELSALKELIDNYTDALDAQKDLYDYQKKIKDQTKDIASLQKQLAAYEGDTSEEAKARIQQIKVSLEEAQENLEETEYDQYISDQKKLLDDLYDEYEDILNSRLDDIDALLKDMTGTVDYHGNIINETIKETAKGVGYDISTSLNTALSAGVSQAIKNISSDSEKMKVDLDNQASNTAAANNNSIGTKSADFSSSTGAYGSTPSDGKATKGDKVTFAKGELHKTPYKKGGTYSSTKINKYLKKQVYIAGVNTASGVDYKYLLATNPDLNKKTTKELGWVKKSQISGYASGTKKINEDEMAWTQEGRKTEAIIRPSDGAILTPLARNDSVLNADATSNLFDFANDPKKFISDKFGLNNLSPTTISKTTGGNSTSQYNTSLQVVLPNVTNYEQFKYEMQHDKSFENMIQAMTVDKISGGSMLRKYKS